MRRESNRPRFSEVNASALNLYVNGTAYLCRCLSDCLQVRQERGLEITGRKGKKRKKKERERASNRRRKVKETANRGEKGHEKHRHERR